MILGWLCVSILLPLSLLALYQWMLAVISILPWPRRKPVPTGKQARFVILIPAHNEEYGLPNTLESLAKLQYPKELMHVIVVADRCDDATATVARRYGVECLERLSGPPGKGAAIAWAIDELRGTDANVDALMILDADTVADTCVLEAFNDGLLSGHEIQQGYNYLSNPWQTPFTRIIAVTSVLRNGFFYAGKSKVGLSAMLTGTGMCFRRKVLKRYGWTAFSVGEDCEFSVSLLLAGEKIHFNPMARVLAKESHNFKQASTQRLRWASGRHAVAASSAWELIMTGLRLRRPYLLDAALTLLAPNYSTQATLAILGLFTAWFLSGDPGWHFLFPWAALLIGFLSAYFLLGVVFTEAPLRALAGIALIPVFLPWRIAIEALGFLGYGRKRWLRAPRVSVSRQDTDH